LKGVDAIVPWCGYAGTYVHEVLHLLALHAALQLALLGGVQSVARIVSVKSLESLCLLVLLSLEQSTPGVSMEGIRWWYVRVHSAHVGYVKFGGFGGLVRLRCEY